MVSFLFLVTCSHADLKFFYARNNGNVYEISIDKLPNAKLINNIGVGHYVGSRTNWLNNNYYYIDTSNGLFSVLMKNGSPVGTLLYNHSPWIVRNQHHGFCIDTTTGKGYILSPDDDDNVAFLLEIDLSAGALTIINYTEGQSVWAINGMGMGAFLQVNELPAKSTITPN